MRPEKDPAREPSHNISVKLLGGFDDKDIIVGACGRLLDLIPLVSLLFHSGITLKFFVGPFDHRHLPCLFYFVQSSHTKNKDGNCRKPHEGSVYRNR